MRGVTKNDAHAALVERQGEVAAGKISRCKVSYLPMVMTLMLVGPLTGLVAGFVAKAGGYGLIWDLILGVVGSSAGNEIVLVVDVFPDAGAAAIALGTLGERPSSSSPRGRSGRRSPKYRGALRCRRRNIEAREPGMVAPELRLVGETWSVQRRRATNGTVRTLPSRTQGCNTAIL